MEQNGFTSCAHRKKLKGQSMPESIKRGNQTKSKIRSRIEHIFAEQKDRMNLFIRTIGIQRATTKIGIANIFYNIKRYTWLETKAAPL